MPDQTVHLLTILSRLVGFKTESGDVAAAQQCLSYIKEFCNDKKLHIEEYVYDDIPNLVISTQKTRTPKVILSGHIDVVPAPEEAYNLVEKDGRAYGRGAYDMKFAVACYMQLLEDLHDHLPRLDFAIMLTSDEEIGGDRGVEPLLHEGYRGDVCIIPDGGDDWCIQELSKGAWLIDIVASGKAAHGSRPWEGKNAIESLMKTVQALQQLNTNSRDGITVVVSKIGGGEAINQVPSNATATLDLRFNSLEEYHQLRQKVLKIVKEGGLEINELLFVDPVPTDLKNSHVKSFRSIMAEVVGKPLEKFDSCISTGSSDGRYFAARDIPVIVCRPVGGGQHSDEEWLDISSLGQYYELLKRYILLHASKKS